MSDLTATNCGCNDSCGCANTQSNGGGCGSWIWILLLLCCCNGNGGNNCGCGCGNGNSLFGGNGGGCEWIIWILLLSCFANVIYNHLVMFPDFYMDTVSGVFRYGTFKGNLLAYSDEFMFQDEIIFPVLRDRQVFLDTDAGFYEKFFSLYAGSCEPLSAVSEHRDAIISRAEDFDFSHEFSCMGIMDYVIKPFDSQDLHNRIERALKRAGKYHAPD